MSGLCPNHLSQTVRESVRDVVSSHTATVCHRTSWGDEERGRNENIFRSAAQRLSRFIYSELSGQSVTRGVTAGVRQT